VKERITLERSLIQRHTSEIIKGFMGEVNALKNLDHDTLKGRLRELFVSRILAKFLASQFGIGSGVIVNQKGDQSKEIDIVICDRGILPPFIEEQRIGVYPPESVLAIIEVRSWVSKEVIKEYSDSAQKLFGEIYNPISSLYQDYRKFQPLYSLVGFYDKGIFKNENENEILHWMMNNAKPLFGVCLVNKFSWLHVVKPEGSLKMVDEYNEETKAFIAVLLDNIRTFSQMRHLSLVQHKDWLGIYIRDQGGVKEIFKKRSAQKC